MTTRYVVLEGRVMPIDTGEQRGEAGRAMRLLNIESADVQPEDGTTFHADCTFGYEGIVNAHAMHWAVHEEFRRRHCDEKAPAFMGYTAIGCEFVLRSLVEKERPLSFMGHVAEEYDAEGEYQKTLDQAEEAYGSMNAYDEDGCLAIELELSCWAASEPQDITCVDITLNSAHNGRVTYSELSC